MRHPIETWHEIASRGDADGLDALLAEDVVFHSPVVHTPQRGLAITKLYLSAAFSVLNNESFRYVREVIGERDAVLEFTTEIDGIHINGVDIIHWNDDSKIDDFKVMVRPLKAINLLHAQMKRMLEQLG
ncbi:MAG: nuclear transport factor 2 family protein [Myxococcales bacterium]|nr:nuclear transport factor 2 family protein [Myxococcales bacterium]